MPLPKKLPRLLPSKITDLASAKACVERADAKVDRYVDFAENKTKDAEEKKKKNTWTEEYQRLERERIQLESDLNFEVTLGNQSVEEEASQLCEWVTEGRRLLKRYKTEISALSKAKKRPKRREERGESDLSRIENKLKAFVFEVNLFLMEKEGERRDVLKEIQGALVEKKVKKALFGESYTHLSCGALFHFNDSVLSKMLSGDGFTDEETEILETEILSKQHLSKLKRKRRGRMLAREIGEERGREDRRGEERGREERRGEERGREERRGEEEMGEEERGGGGNDSGMGEKRVSESRFVWDVKKKFLQQLTESEEKLMTEHREIEESLARIDTQLVSLHKLFVPLTTLALTQEPSSVHEPAGVSVALSYAPNGDEKEGADPLNSTTSTLCTARDGEKGGVVSLTSYEEKIAKREMRESVLYGITNVSFDLSSSQSGWRLQALEGYFPREEKSEDGRMKGVRAQQCLEWLRLFEKKRILKRRQENLWNEYFIKRDKTLREVYSFLFLALQNQEQADYKKTVEENDTKKREKLKSILECLKRELEEKQKEIIALQNEKEEAEREKNKIKMQREKKKFELLKKEIEKYKKKLQMEQELIEFQREEERQYTASKLIFHSLRSKFRQQLWNEKREKEREKRAQEEEEQQDKQRKWERKLFLLQLPYQSYMDPERSKQETQNSENRRIAKTLPEHKELSFEAQVPSYSDDKIFQDFRSKLSFHLHQAGLWGTRAAQATLKQTQPS